MGDEQKAPYVPPPTLEEGRLGQLRVWVALVRDVGVIIGIPVLITVGVSLYELQEKAAEAQLKASEAQIKVIESQVKVVEAQNAALKDTQYDKALALLKSQKELFDQERVGMLQNITEAKEENKVEMLSLRTAIEALTSQISEVSIMETRVQRLESNAQ